MVMINLDNGLNLAPVKRRIAELTATTRVDSKR